MARGVVSGDGSPLSGSARALALAYDAELPAAAGQWTAQAVLGGDPIILGCTETGPDGRERTILLELSDSGDVVGLRALDGFAGRALACTPDGTLAVAGEAQDAPAEYEAALVLFGPGCDSVTERRSAATAPSGYTAVAVLSDGSVLAAGTAARRGLLSPHGRAPRTVDGMSEIAGVVALGDGGYALAGVAERSMVATGMTRVARFAASHRELWSRMLPLTGRAEPAAIVALEGGSVAVVGHWVADASGEAALWCMSLGPRGEDVWERVLAAPAEERRARAAVVSTVGDLVLAGDGLCGERRTVIVASVQADSSPRWEARLAGGGYDVAHAVDALASGDLLVAGSTRANAGARTRAIVWRLDPSGHLIWAHDYGPELETRSSS